MLEFPFRTEYTIYGPRKRPLILTKLGRKDLVVKSLALVDSGADISIIPEDIAKWLGLPIGQDIETRGISGTTKGYKSIVNITLMNNYSEDLCTPCICAAKGNKDRIRKRDAI